MANLANRRLSAISVAALALVASASSLANGFAYDDNSLIADSDRFHSMSDWWLRFAETYWPPVLGRSLYRPLTTLGFSIQWVAGAGSPALFHLTSVVLYVLCAVAVLFLARQLLPPVAAWCAAAVFAVHPVHVEAVGNVVGQSELLAAVAVTLAAALYLRARAVGAPRWRDVAAIGALYAAGCLCKEGAIVLPALLIAAEFTVLWRSDATQARRIARLLPTYVVLLVVGVGELAIRRIVIGSWLGDYPVASLAHLPVGDRVLTMVAASREWVRLFLWPATLSMAYSPPYLPVLHGLDVQIVPGLLALVAAAALALYAWRRMPVVTFGLFWIAIALLPVSNLLFVSGVFIAERTLFLPSVGLALAAGAAVAVVWPRIASDRGRELAATAFAMLLLVAAARSAIRQRVWTDDAHVVTAAVRALPNAYVVDALYGDYLGSHGSAGTAEKWLHRALSLYPDDAQLYVDLGDLYSHGDQWSAAQSSFSRAIAMDATLPSARAGLILCLVHAGDYEGARAQANIGVANGVAADTFRELLATIDVAERRK